MTAAIRAGCALLGWELREADEPSLTTQVVERLDRMLRLGTTMVEAKSGYGLSPEAELKQLNALRAASTDHAVDLVPTFLGAHTVPAEFRENRLKGVRSARGRRRVPWL